VISYHDFLVLFAHYLDGFSCILPVYLGRLTLLIKFRLLITRCKFWISPAPLRGMGHACTLPAGAQNMNEGLPQFAHIILAGRSAGIEDRDGPKWMINFMETNIFSTRPSWF
jgi:hypothetical protein